MNTELLVNLKKKTSKHLEQRKKHTSGMPILNHINFFENLDVTILTHEYEANSFAFHGHDFFEMTYVVSGICRQNLNNDDRVSLERGNICIMNPNAKHSCSIDSKHDIIINILIKPELFNHTLFSFISNSNSVGKFLLSYILSTPSTEKNYLLFKSDYDSYIEMLIERLVVEYLFEKPYANTNIRNLLSLLFSELITKTVRDPSLSKIEKIMEYISSNLDKVDLKTTAAYFHMHPNYLSSYIKKQTNNTFSEICTVFKLTYAKNMLLNHNLCIDDISILLGYSETLSFHNMFKKQTGLTPTQYRQIAGKQY